MSDLVKRYRSERDNDYDKAFYRQTCDNMADEIERLEKERDEAQQENFKNGPWIDDLIKERDELKARLEKYEGGLT